MTQKISQLKEISAKKLKGVEVFRNIDLITKLLQFKTIPQFAYHVQNSLPEYFKYEICTLLFYRAKSNFMSKVGDELCNCPGSTYTGDSKHILRFESKSGISGSSFTENKIIYMNGDRLERNFSDLDNIPGLTRVKSFIFIPLHGYKDKIGRAHV